MASPVPEPPATERVRGFILHCSHLPQTPQAGNEAGPLPLCPLTESPRSSVQIPNIWLLLWLWGAGLIPRGGNGSHHQELLQSVQSPGASQSAGSAAQPGGYQGRQKLWRQGGAGGEGMGAGGGEGEGGPQKSPALPPSGVAPAALRRRCSNRRALTAGSSTRQAGSTRVSRSTQAR